MSDDQSVVLEYDPAWGDANPLRGRNYHTLAADFCTVFPVGSTLSQETFGMWCEEKKVFKVPENATRGSDEWIAHVQRRNRFRYELNNAAAHPRLTNDGKIPFSIEIAGPDTLEVRSIQKAISKSDPGKKISTVCTTQKTRLAYLLQACDFAGVPDWYRMFAETLYTDIQAFENATIAAANHLSNKFKKLESDLRKVGIIKAANDHKHIEYSE